MTRRILHILSQRPSHTGSGVTLDAIVRQAAAAGYEQHVIVGVPHDDPVPAVGNLPRECIHPLVFGTPPLDFALPGMSDVMPYPSSRFSALTDEQVNAYRRAWRAHVQAVVEQVQPELIHSHHLWMVSGMLRDVVPRTPIVTHCHGTGLRQLAQCPQFAGKVLSGCRRNDHFFALHRQQAEELARLLDNDHEHVSVIGAGYREGIFHAQEILREESPTLAYAGKLSLAKGVPQLLDAVEILREDMSDLHLRIAGAGTGEEADRIIERIEQLSANVTWHGQLSPEQLAELFRRCRVMVLPSFYEGLPLVLVEAIACGCRAVATDLPGIRQIADAIPGVVELVPLPKMQTIDQPVVGELPAFVSELCQALRRAVSQESLRLDATLTEPFTWGEVFSRIEHIWRKLLAAE